jgi:hypothetical protein
MIRLASICGALLLSCAGGMAHAQSYVVNTGAGTSHTGLILDGSPNVLDWTQSWHAGQFTLLSETVITGVEAWMTISSSGQMTTAIYSASAGLPRATPALFSATYELTTGGAFMDWHGVSGLSWILGPGTYWLDEEPAQSSTFAGALWLLPPDPLAHYAESIRGNTWEFDPAGRDGLDQFGLRISGAAVPEPAGWALMLAGFAGIGAVLRRRRPELASA